VGKGGTWWEKKRGGGGLNRIRHKSEKKPARERALFRYVNCTTKLAFKKSPKKKVQMEGVLVVEMSGKEKFRGTPPTETEEKNEREVAA